MSIEELVWQCLESAILRFNKSCDNRSLLCPRCNQPKSKTDAAAASERAIAHRLAFYLESELRRVSAIGDAGPVVVDCEYNRHIAAGKSLSAEAAAEIKKIVKAARRKELEADEDGFYVFSVAPDIVVHQRRTDVNNLLVVEIKKRSNPETEKYDKLKLELFTRSKEDEKGFGYRFGAWVVAEDERHPDERELRIIAQYQNGEGKVPAA